MWYVDISGVPDSYLEFLGYVCVAEDDEYKMYRDYTGEEYLVRKSRPLLRVADPNDVAIINRYRASKGMATNRVFRAPPPLKGPSVP